ncbi:hypothetical protein D3OALGA1CA_736 [Olavius algarvensis associated proteobacterium Delta 3]|nr:hypothetical protein D3OALGA1CA_736 [Olavius algarvensis associated proteobacterium Delta 3]
MADEDPGLVADSIAIPCTFRKEGAGRKDGRDRIVEKESDIWKWIRTLTKMTIYSECEGARRPEP